MIDDHDRVVEMLRKQGYTVSDSSVHHPGIEGVWAYRENFTTVDVNVGRELRELAEEKLTLPEVLKRRESEASR